MGGQKLAPRPNLSFHDGLGRCSGRKKFQSNIKRRYLAIIKLYKFRSIMSINTCLRDQNCFLHISDRFQVIVSTKNDYSLPQPQQLWVWWEMMQIRTDWLEAHGTGQNCRHFTIISAVKCPWKAFWLKHRLIFHPSTSVTSCITAVTAP